MTDNEIRELICGYVSAEMELIPDSKDLPDHPSYSRNFNRKMKRLMRAGDYFGGNLRLYNTLRRVAAAILIVFSLACANQASAAIFGFNPWKEVTKLFLPDVEMERKTFEKSDVERDHGGAKPISDVPTYVPEGYVLIDDQAEGTIRAQEWEKKNPNGTADGISYLRFAVSEDSSIIEDMEYDYSYKTEVAGYVAVIRKKSTRVWIAWYDEGYRYTISISGNNAKKELLKKMAESIYY